MNLNEVIEKAAKLIADGAVILYPTDTIWGIGGDATNPDVIQKIYKIKKRSDSKSLVSLVSDLKMLESMTEVTDKVKNLLTETKKPTTVIYNSVLGIHQKALADDGSAAIRIPNNAFCQQLIQLINKPLISTSANLSGAPSPTGFESISEEIKEAVDFIVPSSFDMNSNETASRILKLEGDHIIVIRE